MKPTCNTINEIEQTVARTLPAGNTFELLEEPLPLKDRHILRVITPSWSRMDKMERFSKMQEAILPERTPPERKKDLPDQRSYPRRMERNQKGPPKRKTCLLRYNQQ